MTLLPPSVLGIEVLNNLQENSKFEMSCSAVWHEGHEENQYIVNLWMTTLTNHRLYLSWSPSCKGR